MSDFRQLYELHRQNQEERRMGSEPSLLKKRSGAPRKYKREVIVEAEIFTPRERDFLDALLVKDEYYMEEVKELVRLEMERVVN